MLRGCGPVAGSIDPETIVRSARARVDCDTRCMRMRVACG
ncbi:hypothetical protein LC55x_2895 [Lysobacter capsici]|nr:hypothetical protein LC55x_2895 [Lysobacter capsici]